MPKFGADRSAWRRFIGVHFIFHWGTSIIIQILIGGILIIALAVTLVLLFLNPLLYRNIPLLAVTILERVVGRG